MKKLVFEKYKEDDKKDLTPKIWLYLVEAVKGYPSGDREQAKRVEALWNGLNSLAHREEREGSEYVKLQAKGGTILLENAEYTELKKAWDKVSVNVPGGFIEHRMAVDRFLDEAPEVPKEELGKKK